MPLMYLPLIMYVGWMEFMLQPTRPHAGASAADVDPFAARRY